MNEEAGRGGHLIIPLRLDDGRQLPFLVDTGSPITVLDKSLEPGLGRRLDTVKLWNFGATYEANIYAAPKLYIGHTPLVTDSNALTCGLLGRLCPHADPPVMGILGMDCLKNYCIQLDFKARKMRFMDAGRVKPEKLGQPFPLTLSSRDQAQTHWTCPYIHNAPPAGDEDADVLIDTGADADSLLDPELFGRMKEQQSLRLPPDTARANEPNSIELPQCVWNGADYADLWLRNGANACPDGSGENSLGLRFLARHLVTFDFPARTMYLKQTSSGPLFTRKAVAAGKAAGRSAMKALAAMKKKGHLPGWAETDRQAKPLQGRFRTNPDTITWKIRKKGDKSTYHYTFTRPSADAPWQLQEAWRADENERMIEQYPVS